MNRIQFLIQRDGMESARETTRMQLEVYLRAITNSHGHASSREYREKFVDEALEMAKFIGVPAAMQLLNNVEEKTREKTSKQAPKDAALIAPYLEQLQRAINGCQGDSLAAIEALRLHPLATAPQEAEIRRFTVAKADYERACAVLKAAGIGFTIE